MVDNIFIENYLKPWSTLDRVTSIDKLAKIKKITSFPSSFIINTQPFPQNGHWIVIIFTSPHKSIFFDSLAQTSNLEIKEINNFMEKNCPTVEYNMSSLQNNTSEYCAFFCIAKIMSHMMGESHLIFSNHFALDLAYNDNIVIKLIKSFVSDLLK